MMCKMCDEVEDGLVLCQDCGESICFDDDTAYVTMSGDLFCRRCGSDYDRAEEETWDEEYDGWDYYPADWYRPGSAESELEPEETPREIYIGPGSEYASDMYPGIDTCPHCQSQNTQRIDTHSDDSVIWIVQCGACGETFEAIQAQE